MMGIYSEQCMRLPYLDKNAIPMDRNGIPRDEETILRGKNEFLGIRNPYPGIVSKDENAIPTIRQPQTVQ